VKVEQDLSPGKDGPKHCSNVKATSQEGGAGVDAEADVDGEAIFENPREVLDRRTKQEEQECVSKWETASFRTFNRKIGGQLKSPKGARKNQTDPSNSLRERPTTWKDSLKKFDVETIEGMSKSRKARPSHLFLCRPL